MTVEDATAVGRATVVEDMVVVDSRAFVQRW